MILRNQHVRCCAIGVGILNLLLAGLAAGAPIADTQADYSTAAQGTNGFQYGNYHKDATDPYNNNGVGVFDTTGWTVDGNNNWDGNEGLGTPAVGPAIEHPGFSTLRPAVRRYTVGSGGEPTYTGPVEITGSFSDLDSGLTDGFVTVNGVNLFYHVVNASGGVSPVPFDVIATVTTGSTIDFGVDASTDGGFSDSTNLTATITTIPEPGLCGLMGVLSGLIAIRRRR